MSLTDNGPTAPHEKCITAEDSIYGDLITEIELGDDNVQLMADVKSVDPGNEPNLVDEPTTESADIPATSSTNILSRDVAVSEFFTVDSKADSVFDSDMLISEIDSEGIDFKNETDVVECHHDYDSKKLLFEDEDLVVEDVPVLEEEEEEDGSEIRLSEELEVNEPCFEIAAEEESLNRMHVMEDVEEGCNVSGALPSSPGHAEQRPDPPKELTPVPSTESEKSPVTNGLSTNNQTPEPASSPASPETKEETESKKVVEKEVKHIQKDEEEKKEEIQESAQENEDSNSNDSENSNNKRKCEDDESPAKRLRTQIQQQYITHDKVLSEYMESSGCNSIDELQAHSEQLLAEIRTLNELAREKEREWNNILHLKKVKEELLLRMQRRRQVLLLNSEKGDCTPTEWDIAGEVQLADMLEKNKDGLKINSTSLLTGPLMSSSPVNSRINIPSKAHNRPRSILPKTGFNSNDFNNQNSECRQGRQGPILDVRSIIADYRQRHPETVPRRGRRLKSVLNNSNHGETIVTTSKVQGGSVLNMTHLGLGSGAQVRHGDVSSELGLLLSTMDAAKQDGSRPSSADSSSAATVIGADPNVSFKDVLVQFARLSQSERQELQAQAAAAAAGLAAASQPKPPYPEVTLHPVPTSATATVTQQSNPSLLHGILTKNQPKTDPNKPTTFSPTLARLLTAPERVSNNNAQAMYNAAAAALNSGVSISDLLTSNNKSRNEITITPIGVGQNMKQKDGDNVNDEEEAEDSADRLVIDESGQEGSDGRQRTDNGSEIGDEVPQCQGCHQKSAQFVCAGCGNQWYCSRDCQVAAWDEHSEVCSG